MRSNEETTKKKDDTKNDFKIIPLVPNKSAHNGDFYSKLLNDAINSDDDIYNIAITGGYGSGKSSVIETFIEKHAQKQVIRISLASFNLEKKKKTNTSSTSFKSRVFGLNSDSSNEQIQLEISLLQQFLFQSENWEKEKSQSFIDDFKFQTKALFSILAIFFLFTSTKLLWDLSLFRSWLEIESENYVLYSSLYVVILVLLFLSSSGWFVYFIMSTFKKIKTAKIDLSPISVEITEGEKISILNTYLFQIVKLFRDTNKKIVILEDIDRLDSHILFEKLREINHILRFNPDTSLKKIKFIYSLKESVFSEEKEKNKFFDVIIPVVPYVNHNNSKDKLTSLIKDIEPHFNSKMQEVIQYASYCIDDMRTILNIRNEYLIYKEVTKCNELGNPENLLAIIIYKNLFPNDFEKSNSGESALQRIFNDQESFLIKKRNNLKSLLENLDENLDEIKDDPDAIETESNLLKEQKGRTSSELARLSSQSFMKIIENEDLTEYIKHFEFDENNDVVNRFKFDFLVGMLKKGYIPSNFKHWVSLVHDGILSTGDREFLFSIIKNNPLSFDYKIVDASSVFNELTDDQWNSIACLNYDLFNFAFQYKYKNKVLPVYDTMKNNVGLGLLFIDGYFTVCIHKKDFIGQLISFWDDVLAKMIGAKISIDKWIPFVFTHNDNDSILKQNNNWILSDFINQHQSFIQLLNQEKNTLKSKYLITNLKSLEVKIENLDFESNDKQNALDVILKNAFYELNLFNMNGILKSRSISSTYLCFEYINSLDFNDLKNYVNSDKNAFIENVLIPYNDQENKWIEDRDGFIELLEDEGISIENKKELLNRVETESISFEEIENKDLWCEIIQASKLESNWENLMVYDENFGLDENVQIGLLNNQEWLKKLPIVKNDDTLHDDISSIIDKILETEIEKNCLSLILDKYSVYINPNRLSPEIPKENIFVAIQRGALEPEIDTFNKIKENYPTKFLHIDFIIKYEKDFIEQQPGTFLQFNKNELTYFFQNCESNDLLKKSLELNRNIIIQEFDTSTSKILYNTIIKCVYFEDIDIIIKCLRHIGIEDQILIFNGIAKHNKSFSAQEAIEILKTFCEPFNKMAIMGSRQKLNDTEINRTFSKNLKEKGLIKENKFNEGKESISINRNYSV